MIDLKDVSIITHIRLENKDRLENIKLRNFIMKGLCENAEFITVEDDSEQLYEQYCDKDSIYHFIKNDGSHNKNHAYNEGSKLSTRKYMVFLDADCILHPRNISRLISHGGVFDGVVFPYNRCALYLSPLSKEMLKIKTNYQTLEKFIPEGHLKHGMVDKFGHLYANCPGGSYMMTHEFFEKMNGFNPNFKGWGYEDTEFITRVEKCGYPLNRLSGRESTMFHLHHGDVSRGETQSRSRHLSTNNTRNNAKLYANVAKIKTKEEAEKYNKTWTL